MKIKDPVCGMEIEAERAAARVEHEGRTYYFCSNSCRDEFKKNPKRYVRGS